jgi:hypothetical protein
MDYAKEVRMRLPILSGGRILWARAAVAAMI